MSQLTDASCLPMISTLSIGYFKNQTYYILYERMKKHFHMNTQDRFLACSLCISRLVTGARNNISRRCPA
jgi:hypothetical protein